MPAPYPEMSDLSEVIDNGREPVASADKATRVAEAQLDNPSFAEFGIENFAPYLLNRAAALWNAQLLDAVRAFGLTTTKMRALAVLTIYEELTVNELSVHAATEQSTMSRTLDALELANFVQRKAPKHDGRVRTVSITPAGAAFFNAFWPSMLQRHRNLMAGVDDQSFAVFTGVLKKIIGNLERNSRD